jgi:hypothetical protein
LADAMLAEAVRRGWLSPPSLRGEEPPPRKPVALAQHLLEELARDRGER